MSVEPPQSVTCARWPSALTSVWYCCLSSSIVMLGVWIGAYELTDNGSFRGYVGSFVYVDGTSHAEIVNHGYPRAWPPCAARFPAYPLLAWCVKQAAGVSAETALVIVAQLCLLGAFAVGGLYFQERSPAHTGLALLAMGLWPSTLFFHMAYTESLFLVTAILALYGMERRWPTAIISLMVGLNTATRPVGVALVAVFTWHLWREAQRAAAGRRESNDRPFSPSCVWQFLGRAAYQVPLACWGLLGYMLFLAFQFDDPLAFAHAHAYWAHRPTPWAQKLIPLLTFEPIWSPYIPGNPAYWRTVEPTTSVLLSFGLVNPLVFVLTAAGVVVGGVKKWLNDRELILCTLLLAIPYMTLGYDNLMLSQPRFASVIFPAYLVMARWLRPLPWWLAAAFFVGCALLLGTYSACFAAGYGQWHAVLY